MSAKAVQWEEYVGNSATRDNDNDSNNNNINHNNN